MNVLETRKTALMSEWVEIPGGTNRWECTLSAVALLLLFKVAQALPQEFFSCLSDNASASTYVAVIERYQHVQTLGQYFPVKGVGQSNHAREAYFVSFDSWADRARLLPGVRSVKPIDASRKKESSTFDSSNVIATEVLLNLGWLSVKQGAAAFRAMAAREVEAIMQTAEATCVRRNKILVQQAVDDSIASLFAGKRFVSKVRPIRLAKGLNFEAIPVTQSGTSWELPMWTNGYTGKGQIIGVSDTGLDRYHCAFDGDTEGGPKLKLYNTPPALPEGANDRISRATSRDHNGHGTHVSGSAVGRLRNFSGVAKDAQIVMNDMEICIEEPNCNFRCAKSCPGVMIPQLDFEDWLIREHHEGVSVSSHSWGKHDEQYSDEARDMDKMMRENDDFLVVVAAGNRGNSEEQLSQQTDRQISTPGDAKNVLTVGAAVKPSHCDHHGCSTSNLRDGSFTCFSDCPPGAVKVADFSSRDYPFDRRRQLDLVATGSRVYSACATNSVYDKVRNCGTCDVTFASGSSMATPLVSGSAAILREFFQQELGLQSPSNNLLRAGLAASSVRLHGESGIEQGIGHVRLDNVKNYQIVKDRISVQENSSVQFSVQADHGTVVAALAWNDVETDENSFDVEVHTPLDIEVQCIGFTSYNRSQSFPMEHPPIEFPQVPSPSEPEAPTSPPINSPISQIPNPAKDDARRRDPNATATLQVVEVESKREKDNCTVSVTGRELLSESESFALVVTIQRDSNFSADEIRSTNLSFQSLGPPEVIAPASPPHEIESPSPDTEHGSVPETEVATPPPSSTIYDNMEPSAGSAILKNFYWALLALLVFHDG